MVKLPIFLMFLNTNKFETFLRNNAHEREVSTNFPIETNDLRLGKKDMVKAWQIAILVWFLFGFCSALNPLRKKATAIWIDSGRAFHPSHALHLRHRASLSMDKKRRTEIHLRELSQHDIHKYKNNFIRIEVPGVSLKTEQKEEERKMRASWFIGISTRVEEILNQLDSNIIVGFNSFSSYIPPSKSLVPATRSEFK